MQTIDRMVMATLTDRILTDDRVRQMLLMLKQDSSRADKRGLLILKPLTTELEKNRQATERLFDAVESGTLPNDATRADRAHKLKARREEILSQIAGVRREAEIPDTLISPKNMRAAQGCTNHGKGNPDAGELQGAGTRYRSK